MKKWMLLVCIMWCIRFDVFLKTIETNSYEISIDDKKVFINKDGKITKPNENRVEKDSIRLIDKGDISVTPYINGYCYAVKQIVPDFYILYVENGEIIPGAEEEISGRFGGIIDIDGNVIIPFTLGEYTFVSENLIRCQEKYIENNNVSYSLYGFKNLRNEWVVNPCYKTASHYKNGYSVVSNNHDEFFVINKSGKRIFKKNYNSIYILSEKLFVVSENGITFHLIDVREKIKSKDFDVLNIIDDYMIKIQMDNQLFYLNYKGQFFNFLSYFND